MQTIFLPWLKLHFRERGWCGFEGAGKKTKGIPIMYWFSGRVRVRCVHRKRKAQRGNFKAILGEKEIIFHSV